MEETRLELMTVPPNLTLTAKIAMIVLLKMMTGSSSCMLPQRGRSWAGRRPGLVCGEVVPELAG